CAPQARSAGAGARGGSRSRRRGGSWMTEMVQVALAEDITEAEEIQEILRLAGIGVHLQTPGEHHSSPTQNAPQKVLGPEPSLEQAQHAIEAMTDPDEMAGD